MEIMHQEPKKLSPARDWLKVLDPAKDDVRVEVPPAGVPVQQLPAFLRRFIQCLFYPFMRLDLAAQALLRWIIPPPYKRTGQCKMTGKCCRYLGQDKPKGGDWPFFRWWSFEINGFYERGFEVDGPDTTQMRVYSCRHLTAQGRCGNYAWRPAVCRAWPRIDYFGQPTLMKGCGYQLEPRRPRKDL